VQLRWGAPTTARPVSTQTLSSSGPGCSFLTTIKPAQAAPPPLLPTSTHNAPSIRTLPRATFNTHCHHHHHRHTAPPSCHQHQHTPLPQLYLPTMPLTLPPATPRPRSLPAPPPPPPPPPSPPTVSLAKSTYSSRRSCRRLHGLHLANLMRQLCCMGACICMGVRQSTVARAATCL